MIRRRLCLIAAILFIAMTAAAQDSPIVAAAKRGRLGMRLPVVGAAPEIDATQWWNSAALRLEGLRGNVVMVDMWATWCASCVAALPKVQAIAHDLPLKVILLHTPNAPYGVQSDIGAFLAQKHVTLPVALISERCLRAFGEKGFPTYVLVDKQGRVRWRDNRMPDVAAIRSVIAEP